MLTLSHYLNDTGICLPNNSSVELKFEYLTIVELNFVLYFKRFDGVSRVSVGLIKVAENSPYKYWKLIIQRSSSGKLNQMQIEQNKENRSAI